MALIGYARLSPLAHSSGQKIDSQLKRLKAAGAEKIFHEIGVGEYRVRSQLQRCVECLQKGDTLLVTGTDRLAIPILELNEIIEILTEKGTGFQVINQANIETVTSNGKLFFAALATKEQLALELEKQI